MLICRKQLTEYVSESLINPDGRPAKEKRSRIRVKLKDLI